MDRIEISVGRQWDGCTFQLHPLSKAMIEKKFPGLHPAKSVFISYENQQQSEWMHSSMWRQVASILTGLPENQVEELFEVVFVDPVEGREIFNSCKENV